MNIKQIISSVALLASITFPLAADAAQPMVVKSGTFVSGAHGTSGTATIYTLADGSHILRLSNFETSNGPKVHVLLDNHVIMGSGHIMDSSLVDLGDLKGTSGNQNYKIPAGTDVSKVKSVAIYCERFHVTFGSAKLHK